MFLKQWITYHEPNPPFPLRLQKKMTDQIRDTTKARLGSTLQPMPNALGPTCWQTASGAQRWPLRKLERRLLDELFQVDDGSTVSYLDSPENCWMVHTIHINIIDWHASTHGKLQCFMCCFGMPTVCHNPWALHCIAKECLENAQEQEWGLIWCEPWPGHQPNEHSWQSTVLLLKTFRDQGLPCDEHVA